MGAVRSIASEVASALARAERACAARGVRLTANRRDVLALLLAERGRPVPAYTLLDRLRASHPGAVPPTVYRALDFLMAQGLVHKIELLNAYVGCADGAFHDHHPAQFLICRGCGGVTEVEDDGVAAALDLAARECGFTPAHATVEIEGTCGTCASARP
ncbi:MAG: transcriptional repressor [Acetobacteraceae bacterium]|nr:transcriptional repressor [Acetobacteraceae bacterium]